MSAGEEATTGFSFDVGAPIQEGPSIAAVAEATADQWVEGIDSMDVDEDNQFETMKEKDERVLTNMKKFFPELVWGKVVGKLKKKEEIENCSNASPFFGDLLEEARARKVVLPKVFRILAQRFLDEENKDESYQETSVESIPWERPRRRGRTTSPMTGIWKFRLVAKKFNEAIEEIHRNEDAGHYQLFRDISAAEIYQLGSKWGNESFSDEFNVVKFLHHFEASHYDCVDGGILKRKCPFLGRCVEINYNLIFRNNGERDQPYFDKLMEMLGKFGGEVSYLEFDCWWHFSFVNNHNHVDIYRELKEMVELMPNLKVLRVKYSDIVLKKNNLQALAEEIERNPFPQLAKLEMILLDHAPVPLCNNLVNQNRHITRLDVTSVNFNGDCLILTDTLPNLTHLSLNVDSIETLEAFERYPLRFKLHKLYFLFGRHAPFVPWSRVFGAIQAKCDSDSCKDLLLEMPEPQTDAERQLVLEESFEWRLTFGKIERFHLQQLGRHCLDFLLTSKNCLKEISLYCNQKYEYKYTQLDKFMDAQVIQFVGFEDMMQFSNIAKELPHLKKLVVCNFSGRLYTLLY